MKITVLGNQGPFCGAGGAASGYLLETELTKILIDCGSGVLSNLQKVCKIEQLDAIILSHLHNDHMSDMGVLKYAISVSRVRPFETAIDSIPVYCPLNPMKDFDSIDNNVFEVNVINRSLNFSIKDIDFSFAQMEHPVETYAIKATSNGKVFVYSGDTIYNTKLIEFSKNADLLLTDAGYTDKHDVGVKLVHMTARENGIIANETKVKKLLLTHFWPTDDLSVHLKEAKEEFENVECSELLKSYEI